MFHRVSRLARYSGLWLILDSYHGDRGHPYPSSDDGLLGSCTGMLSCTAVSSCKNVGELLPLAVEIVRLTIHLGLCVMRVREMVDSTESSSGSWSILVSEINEADATSLIGDFVKKRVSTVYDHWKKNIDNTREFPPRRNRTSARLDRKVSPSVHHPKFSTTLSKKVFRRSTNTSRLLESVVRTTRPICTMTEKFAISSASAPRT